MVIDWSKPVRECKTKIEWRVLCTDRIDKPIVLLDKSGALAVSDKEGFFNCDMRFENIPEQESLEYIKSTWDEAFEAGMKHCGFTMRCNLSGEYWMFSKAREKSLGKKVI